MTAETLKPFITPTSAGHYPATHTTNRRRRSGSALAIGLSAASIVLVALLVALAIWHSVRISSLETEVKTLNRVVESMRDRLGLNYLEDLEDFKKEYSNVLIDIPNNSTDNDDVDEDDEGVENINDADDEGDDDDDDDDFYPGEYTDFDNEDDLDDIVKKYNSYDSADDEDDDADEDNSETVDMNASDDDNLYDDYGKYKDSKKKQSTRKTRSISSAPNGLPIHEDSYLEHLNKSALMTTYKVGQDSKEDNQEQQQRISKKPSMRSSLDTSHDIRNSHHKFPTFVGEKIDERRRDTPLRQRGHRRRKIPVMKSGESLLSAKLKDQNEPTSSFLPAAHFHLHSKVPDRYASLRVESYPGDMYLGTPSASHHFALERYFSIENGLLTVREPGLYYVYAQVCYNNTHDQNGFVIFHGHKPFLQCLNTVPTNITLKIHTCHTSGLIHLQANETIHLRDFHSDRSVILKGTHNRSYFGLIKI